YGVWSDEVSGTLVVTEKPQAFIDAISPDTAVEWQIVSFEGHGTDDGSIERHVWRSSLDGEIHNGTTSDFGTDGLSVGEHTIYFRAQDNYGVWSDEVSATLTINGRPIAFIDLITPSPALDTDTITFSGSGADDGSIVRYAWRSSFDGEFYNGSEAEFDHSSSSVGTHTIHFKVQDNYGVWSDEVSTTLTITEHIPPNQKPTITITSPANNSEISGTVKIAGAAHDADRDTTLT
ncbi:unnamed protein product, partial [marine sediment metagenome]